MTARSKTEGAIDGGLGLVPEYMFVENDCGVRERCTAGEARKRGCVYRAEAAGESPDQGAERLGEPAVRGSTKTCHEHMSDAYVKPTL